MLDDIADLELQVARSQITWYIKIDKAVARRKKRDDRGDSSEPIQTKKERYKSEKYHANWQKALFWNNISQVEGIQHSTKEGIAQ